METEDLAARVGRQACEAGLLDPGDGVVVAVSGGLDSTVLLHILAALRASLDLDLHTFHLHHNLRGAEADADADHVGDLCRALGVPLTVERLPAGWASAGGVQARARSERYRRLEVLRAGLGARRVATAHTRSDQVETVLARVARGTGIGGLAGIPARRGSIVRPLLEVGREEIEAWARARGIGWREDASNADPRYERSRIRHQALPMLRATLNPRIDDSLLALADAAAADESYLADAAAEALRQAPSRLEGGGIGLDAGWLVALPSALGRRVVLGLLRDLDAAARPGHREVLRVLELAGTGGALDLPGGVEARVRGGRLHLRRRLGPPPPLPLLNMQIPGLTCLPSVGIVVEASGPRPVPPRATWCVPPERCLLDAEAVGAPLVIRGIRPGDRIHPLGSPGTRKVHALLVDAKVPRERRADLPLVCRGEDGGDILWVVGVRSAESGKLTASTRWVYELQVRPLLPAQGG